MLSCNGYVIDIFILFSFKESSKERGVGRGLQLDYTRKQRCESNSQGPYNLEQLAKCVMKQL